MPFFRCFFFSCFLFVCCIACTVETFAQEGTAPIPDTPQVCTTAHGQTKANRFQAPIAPGCTGRKARFSLLSQSSSKSPSGFPFMTKLAS